MIGFFSDHWVTMLNGVALGFVLFALAVGFSLVFGILDVLNLAHGSLFLAGAYAAWRLAGDGDPSAFFLAVLLAVGIGGAGGLVLTAAIRPIAARGHLDQALLTLGIALVVTELVQVWFGDDPHAVIPPLTGSVDLGGGYPTYRLAVIAVGAAVALGVDVMVERTRLGALVRATVVDSDMVAALGVNTRLVRAGTFALGAVLAATAGVFGAPLLGANPHLDSQVLLLALVVVVVGGLGSVRGALVGALLIGQVQSLGVALAPEQAPFLLFGTMALVLVIRPTGLVALKVAR